MKTTTFTVTKGRKIPRSDPNGGALACKYTLTIDLFPDRTFGPYDFREMRGQLETAAFMLPVESRNMVLDAYLNGSASYIYAGD